MSSPLSEELKQILDRFEAAWNGPTPPRIENFLPPPHSPAHLPVLISLVRIDMERRRQRGEQPKLDDYRQRFPTYRDVLAEGRDEADTLSLANPSLAKETEDNRTLPTLEAPSMPSKIDPPLRTVGEYELLERLGSGGMGEIYKARHRHLGKLVALKLLPANPRDPHVAAARFRREMKAVGTLDHPNVVEAHDAGEQSGIVYLAMKLIDGIDLERLVKERGPLPIAEACDLVRQAALGLGYLHEHGLAHRDVKPSNLMRTPDGTVKVLDLGLARWCAETDAGHGLTGTDHVMGTPDFLAPEQIENAAEADARADLYGLGGTLFYLLTGRAPFAEYKSLFAKLSAHRSEPPPDVRKLRPDVPEELGQVIHRLLAKQPEERFRTAAEVAAALKPFAENNSLKQTGTADRMGQPSAILEDGKSKSRGERKLAIGLTVGRWSCSLSVVIGVTVAVLVGLPFWWRAEQRSLEVGYQMSQTSEALPEPSRKSDQVAEPAASPDRKGSKEPKLALSEPQPIHVIKLDVMLTRGVQGKGMIAGRIGEKVFDPHLGDTVTVEGRLTRPAYSFLIAFRPDGQAEVCFPESENEPPPRTDRPRYPSRSQDVEYGLTDGVGLAAFALVVSRKPLPAFKEWWAHGQDCPWKKADAPPGVVFRANGEDSLEAWSAPGQTRGKGVRVEGKSPLAKLAVWLRKMPDVETVQILGFAVETKEKR